MTDSTEPRSAEGFIDIVFDGPPSHESGRFVEVEDERGYSVSVGQWIDRGNGLWALRLPRPTTDTVERAAVWLEAQKDDALARYAGDMPDTIVIDLATRLRALPSAGGGEVEKLLARVSELEAVLRDIVATDDGAMREMQSLGIEVSSETKALTERARAALQQEQDK